LSYFSFLRNRKLSFDQYLSSHVSSALVFCPDFFKNRFNLSLIPELAVRLFNFLNLLRLRGVRCQNQEESYRPPIHNGIRLLCCHNQVRHDRNGSLLGSARIVIG
jgi:hypothetical protein